MTYDEFRKSRGMIDRAEENLAEDSAPKAPDPENPKSGRNRRGKAPDPENPKSGRNRRGKAPDPENPVVDATASEENKGPEGAGAEQTGGV